MKEVQYGSMELLTFTEAATFAGVSSKTIHKHVKQGKLTCVETPLGRRIEKARLLPYRNLLGTDESGWEPAELPEEEHSGTSESVWEAPDRTFREESLLGVTVGERQGVEVSTVPLQAHLSALDLARSQLERTQAWLDEERERVMLAHQLVIEAERAKVSLESQLSQYQRVLTEQAESLAEERALRLTWQARSEEAASEAPLTEELQRQKEEQARQAELLRVENLRYQELWQAEKAQLISELTHHQERVNWLEKRVPRWVRGFFGAK